ncbi:MAG: hypothetical protein AAF212_05930 [Verrucomicrobiota bacterium]
MKILLDEISGDSSVSCIQVSDAAGNPIVSRHDDTFKPEKCQRLGGLILELETSTKQALFEPDGIELEFEDMQLTVAKAQKFTIAVVADAAAHSEKLRSYVERVRQEIESQPESRWRNECGAEAASEVDKSPLETDRQQSPEAGDQESKTNPGIAPTKNFTVSTSKSAANALSKDREASVNRDDEEDMIESLNIDPKQKAILRIQQKALIDAKQRSMLLVKNKQEELRSLAKGVQAQVEALNKELKSRSEFIDKRVQVHQELSTQRETAAAECGKIKLAIKTSEEAKAASDSQLKAKLEHESLHHRQELQKLDEAFAKKSEFANSKIALARKSAEELGSQLEMAEKASEDAKGLLEKVPSDTDASIEKEKTRLEQSLQSDEKALNQRFSGQISAAEDRSEKEISELTEKSRMLEMSLQKASEATKEAGHQLEKQTSEAAGQSAAIREKIESFKAESSKIGEKSLLKIKEIDGAFRESEESLLKRKQEQSAIIAQKDVEEEELRLEFERRLKEINAARDEAQKQLDRVSEDQAIAADKAESDRLSISEKSENRINAIKQEIQKLEQQDSKANEAISGIQQLLKSRESDEAKASAEHQEAELQLETKMLEALEEKEKLEGHLQKELTKVNTVFAEKLSSFEKKAAQDAEKQKAEVGRVIKEKSEIAAKKRTELEKVRLEIGENLTGLQEEESQLNTAKKNSNQEHKNRKTRLTEESETRVHQKNQELEALIARLEKESKRENQLIAKQDQTQAEIAELQKQLSGIQDAGQAEITEKEKEIESFQKEVEEAEAEVSLVTDAIRSSLAPYTQSESETDPARPSNSAEPLEGASNPKPEKIEEEATDDSDSIWGEDETVARKPQTTKPSSANPEKAKTKLPRFTRSPFTKTQKADESTPQKGKTAEPKKKVTGTIFGKRPIKQDQAASDEDDDIWG